MNTLRLRAAPLVVIAIAGLMATLAVACFESETSTDESDICGYGYGCGSSGYGGYGGYGGYASGR